MAKKTSLNTPKRASRGFDNISNILSKSKIRSERPKVKNAAKPLIKPTNMDLKAPFISPFISSPNAAITVSIAVGMTARKGSIFPIFAPISKASRKMVPALLPNAFSMNPNALFINGPVSLKKFAILLKKLAGP